MREKYKKLLETTYELEGLLLLAMTREEMPEGLEALILKKIEELRGEKALQNVEIPAPAAADDVKTAEKAPEQAPEQEEAQVFYAFDDEDDEEPTPAPAPVSVKRKPPVFSLNDRFLFMRELFGGDKAAFDVAMDRVAAMSGFAEAQAYLESEFGLNAERDIDADFFSQIEDYFKATFSKN